MGDFSFSSLAPVLGPMTFFLDAIKGDKAAKQPEGDSKSSNKGEPAFKKSTPSAGLIKLEKGDNKKSTNPNSHERYQDADGQWVTKVNTNALSPAQKLWLSKGHELQKAAQNQDLPPAEQQKLKLRANYYLKTFRQSIGNPKNFQYDIDEVHNSIAEQKVISPEDFTPYETGLHQKALAYRQKSEDPDLSEADRHRFRYQFKAHMHMLVKSLRGRLGANVTPGL